MCPARERDDQRNLSAIGRRHGAAPCRGAVHVVSLTPIWVSGLVIVPFAMMSCASCNAVVQPAA